MSSTQLLRHGVGEPMLLLHGVGSRAEVWSPLSTALGRTFDVIAVDLPGFGQSPTAAFPATVEGYADHLQGLLAELDVERPHVVGHSLGGAIALELGRRGAARSVVAFAPIGFWGASGLIWAQGFLSTMRRWTPRVRPALPRLLASPWGRAVGFGVFYAQARAMTASTLLSDADAFAGANAVAEALTGFGSYVFADVGDLPRMPVTVAWGARDGLLPARTQAPRARDSLPTAEHVLLQRCGHVPFVDDLRVCEELILRTAHRPGPPALTAPLALTTRTAT